MSRGKVGSRLSITDNLRFSVVKGMDGEASAAIGSQGFVSRHRAGKPKTDVSQRQRLSGVFGEARPISMPCGGSIVQ